MSLNDGNRKFSNRLLQINLFVVAGFFAYFLICPSGHAENKGKAMDMSPVQVVIHPVIEGYSIALEMTAKNFSKNDAYIENLFFEHELEAPLFKINSQITGLEVKYVGIMVKRAAFTIKDYRKLSPQQTVTQKINIQNSYDFPKQVDNYNIQYGLVDVDPVTGKITERRSNIAHFVYPGN